jgi:16S rRNA processing protein RimM
LTNKYINIGRIKNTFKGDGLLILKSNYIKEHYSYSNISAWIKIADDEYLPAVIEEIRRSNSTYLIKIKGINSSDRAALYQSSELLIKNNIEKIKWPDKEILGFNVLDIKKRILGEVIQLINIPKNPLLVVNMDGKKIMIPFVKEYIYYIDILNKTVTVQNYQKLINL